MSENKVNNSAGFSSVVVRVKRKRNEVSDAPDVLLLPQKKSKNEPLEKALASLSVEPDKKRQVLVCALVKDDEKSTDKISGKRTADTTIETDENNASKIKRRRIVELEINSDKGLSTRILSDQESEDLDYAVWYAVQNGSTELLKQVYKNPSVNVNFQRRCDGVSPLMAACSVCDVELIEDLLKNGADVSLQDFSGFDARDRIGFSLENPSESLLNKVVDLLNGSDFVYDEYIVKESIELSCISETSSKVWKTSGLPTAWQDAVIADFELDLDQILESENLLVNEEQDSVQQSDLENEDDENYLYNDYPDEESDEDDENAEDEYDFENDEENLDEYGFGDDYDPRSNRNDGSY